MVRRGSDVGLVPGFEVRHLNLTRLGLWLRTGHALAIPGIVAPSMVRGDDDGHAQGFDKGP